MAIEVIKRIVKHTSAEHSAWQVLIMLAEHADPNGWSWPSANLLQMETRLKRTAVLSSLQWLRERGEIYIQPNPGKAPRYFVAVGLTEADIIAQLQACPECKIDADRAVAVAVEILEAQKQHPAKSHEVTRHSKSRPGGTKFVPQPEVVQNSYHSGTDFVPPVVRNLYTNRNIEPEKNHQTLATAETSVEAQPENLLTSQEPAQPTEQADAPMPEGKDPNPQVRRAPFPISAGDRVNWQTVGGWGGGASVQAAARVLAVKGQRVAIAVYDLRAKAVAEKTVTPGKLTPRDATSAQDADLDAYFDQWTAKRDKPRKEPERGPLYKAVHEVLLGITDPGDGKHMISRINGLRRVVLDAESVGKPTAEQDTQIAEYLRVQFPRWYRKHNGQRPNDPPLALPTNPQKVAHWYGRYAEARRNYDAQQAAEAIKPTPAQADPGCPHCGGTGKVSIYKSANDKWVPMRYGDLVPAGVTETASATCRCILTKGA